MIRRGFTLILSLFLLAGMFLTACGQKPSESSDNNTSEAVPESAPMENPAPENTAPIVLPAQMPAISGQIIEVGKFTVLIPEGWFAHPVYMNEALRDDQVNVVKGTDDPAKAFDAPLLSLSFGSKERPISFVDKEFYDDSDAKDIEPVVIGGRTFRGYTAKSLGYDLLYLFAEEGGQQFQVVMYYNQPEGQISLEDADVRAIIESFNPKQISGMSD